MLSVGHICNHPETGIGVGVLGPDHRTLIAGLLVRRCLGVHELWQVVLANTEFQPWVTVAMPPRVF